METSEREVPANNTTEVWTTSEQQAEPSIKKEDSKLSRKTKDKKKTRSPETEQIVENDQPELADIPLETLQEDSVQGHRTKKRKKSKKSKRLQECDANVLCDQAEAVTVLESDEVIPLPNDSETRKSKKSKKSRKTLPQIEEIVAEELEGVIVLLSAPAEVQKEVMERKSKKHKKRKLLQEKEDTTLNVDTEICCKEKKSSKRTKHLSA